jgi:TPP-dependent pyruvate/acetoin dehydrogenase alpha subunit
MNPSFFSMNNLSIAEKLFYQSLRIRLVEERLIALYPADKIQSPVHLSIGQEAVATGICGTLRLTDLLFATYRSHAFYLAKGGDLKQMIAELYGKQTGGCGGKAGSMHLAAPEVGFMGSSAVVASAIPHAVGAALAAKQRRSGQVIVTVFGDGATEEGVFHESLNFAAKHQVPVLFICENNGLAVHSQQSARQAYNVQKLAEVYGIPVTEIAAGYDDLAVNQKMLPLVKRAREQSQPQFVEIKTFRYREHVGPGEDWDAGYRQREEMARWQKKDPLIQRADWIARFRRPIEQEIDEAVAFAEASPWPVEAELLTHVI